MTQKPWSIFFSFLIGVLLIGGISVAAFQAGKNSSNTSSSNQSTSSSLASIASSSQSSSSSLNSAQLSMSSSTQFDPTTNEHMIDAFQKLYIEKLGNKYSFYQVNKITKNIHSQTPTTVKIEGAFIYDIIATEGNESTIAAGNGTQDSSNPLRYNSKEIMMNYIAHLDTNGNLVSYEFVDAGTSGTLTWKE